MRPDTSLDDTVPSFTLVCTGYRSGRFLADGVREAGNLTFTIGAEVVAEIELSDLIESWRAACELTSPEALKMTEIAATHLIELLGAGLAAGDLTDAVTDAAVVLLLAMKRQGVLDPKRIPACTVMWNGHEGRERVFFGA
jgi:hypothetical protein